MDVRAIADDRAHRAPAFRVPDQSFKMSKGAKLSRGGKDKAYDVARRVELRESCKSGRMMTGDV